ncbi:MAG TPA: hypothetical protein VGS19_26900 [Streptosporangiaceae bacterium]|nr:hypothetical protein [Streptosporangiaceae bacterium]
MGDDAPPEAGEPGQPPAPFTPEDGYYAAIVSEYLGLQRGGADPFSAALITAAHLMLLGIANQAQQHPEQGEQEQA